MSQFRKQLLSKISSHQAKVAVIGLGYVGLPLAVEFARAGFNTIGIDVSAHKVKSVNAGRSYIGDVPGKILSQLVKKRKLRATAKFDVLRECDAVLICVPTPLAKTHAPDLSYIVSAAKEIVKYVHGGMLIVLESTTYPGTTEEIIVPQVVINGFTVGRDVFVAFSPERIDPGRKDLLFKDIPKIIGGTTTRCLEIAQELYRNVSDHLVPVSSAAAAEMAKLLENTFRAVNIALVNEVLIMCDKLDLDAWEVIEAAATKPYGFMKFTPGPGIGGHCIPLDPHYLSWKLRTLDYHARFIQLAEEINAGMPSYWVSKVAEELNERRKTFRGSRVLVLGVTYKPDIDDVRESPALDIIELLEKRGARVAFNDPFVNSLKAAGLKTPFVELTNKTLKESDCVVIVTDHSAYDWNLVRSQASLIVDCRNALGRTR